jgi:hypothetical protein
VDIDEEDVNEVACDDDVVGVFDIWVEDKATRADTEVSHMLH